MVKFSMIITFSTRTGLRQYSDDKLNNLCYYISVKNHSFYFLIQKFFSVPVIKLMYDFPFVNNH